MEISFPYEYYIIAIDHKGKQSKRVETHFAGIDSLAEYPSGFCSFKGASCFSSEREALDFFSEYKKYLITSSKDMFESFNPRIIKVTCVEDPIVEGNSERSL